MLTSEGLKKGTLCKQALYLRLDLRTKPRQEYLRTGAWQGLTFVLQDAGKGWHLFHQHLCHALHSGMRSCIGHACMPC